MSDEHDDPPARAPSLDSQRRRAAQAIQSAEARDLAARKRRREQQGYPFGVPAVPQADGCAEGDAEDVTAPLTLLLERPLADDAAEKIQRLRRESPDPYELAFRIADDLTTLKRKNRSESREQNAAFFTLLEVKPEEFRAMIRWYRGQRWLLRLMAGGAFAALLLALAALWNRSSAETSARKDLEYAGQRIDRLEHYVYPERAAWPPLPTTKGP